MRGDALPDDTCDGTNCGYCRACRIQTAEYNEQLLAEDYWERIERWGMIGAPEEDDHEQGNSDH